MTQVLFDTAHCLECVEVHTPPEEEEEEVLSRSNTHRPNVGVFGKQPLLGP